MKLVMIHGRDQAGKNSDALKQEWLDDLKYGLDRAGRKLPAGTTVEFPFYGDALARLVKAIGSPLGADVNAKGIDSDATKLIRAQLLGEIMRNAGLTEADIGREFRGSPAERGPLNWEWVQSILRALDRIPGLNSDIIDAFTRDVYLYMTYPGVRNQIDDIVRRALGAEPCVVLAHSLGTIVAYNVLYAQPASPPCLRLITVGSPLGLNAVKDHIERPLRSPACVGHWFNAYDDRDVVALQPLDSENFGVTPPIENKDDVTNYTENRHGIAGYLSDPVVAAKIVEYL